MPKFKYEWTVEETTTDTRVYNIKSNINLSEEELRELSCQVEECPGEKYKENEVEVIYEETIYGDDSHWDFTLHTTTASIEDELNAKERLLKILKVKDKGEN